MARTATRSIWWAIAKTRSGAFGLNSQTLNYDQNDWLDNDSTTTNASLYFDAKGNREPTHGTPQDANTVMIGRTV